MFPLAAIGAGLGQFAQDYRQQQESALRQMVVRQQMEEFLRKRQDDQLLGAAALGGKIPGFGPMNIPGQQQPIQGLPRQQAPSPLPAGQQPPSQPGYYAPPDMTTAGEAIATPQSDAVPGAIDLQEPPTAAELARAEPEPGAPVALDTPAASPAPSPSTAEPAVAATSGSIDTPNEFSQYLGMFRQADPSAIAQHIKGVRPGADDGAVWRATATLMKMASGNVREQLGAASMMKFLLGEQGRTQRAGIQSDDRAKARDLRAGIATGEVGGKETVSSKTAKTAAGNLEVRKQAQAALQEYRKAREAGVQGRFDQRQLDRVVAAADKASADAIKMMARRHGLLKSQIDAMDMSMEAAKPETKKKREQVFREMQDLERRIDARVQQIEKANPVTESE